MECVKMFSLSGAFFLGIIGLFRTFRTLRVSSKVSRLKAGKVFFAGGNRMRKYIFATHTSGSKAPHKKVLNSFPKLG